MSRFARLLAPALFAPALLTVNPAHAAKANPLIDYDGFIALTLGLAQTREEHRLPWDEFAAGAQAQNAILLDTRSAAAFAAGHIDGAINLPFSDFTQAALATALGADQNRPIYIYCNNNFSDNQVPVVTKKAPLALNIPTFINLHGYGYTNVWELADVMRLDDPRLPWAAAQFVRLDQP